MEPDHAFNIGKLVNKYPEMKIVGNQTTFSILLKFFNIDNFEERKVYVHELKKLNVFNGVLVNTKARKLKKALMKFNLSLYLKVVR